MERGITVHLRQRGLIRPVFTRSVFGDPNKLQEGSYIKSMNEEEMPPAFRSAAYGRHLGSLA